MLRPLTKHPWLLIVIAFLLVIGAWSTLISIAHRHPTEEVPIVTAPKP